jgi:CDP-glycerol glycerophosphotransferase (TagB/SpsB family)
MRRVRAYARVFVGNLILHPLAKLFPRDRRLWAFGAPDGRFDGNSKYLFLWMSRQSWPVKPIWITRNRKLAKLLRQRGFASAHRWSLEGMRAAARASVYLVNDNTSDINFSFSGGARIFNLWHGVGLKNVRYGAHVGSGARLRSNHAPSLSKLRNMRRLETPEWVLATSPDMATQFFGRCFGLPAERAPALGYPRLDVVVDEQLKWLGRSFDDYSLLERRDRGTKHIIYVPTLRDESADFLRGALPDLDRLSTALESQRAQLFLKLHPKMKVDSNANMTLPSNINILPADLDIYPVLHDFDALITDYSSLFYDYIYAQSSGVVLYTYDINQYTATERDLAWSYDEATVGVRAGSFAELCEAIRSGQAFADLDPAQLDVLRKRFWGGEPGSSTASEKIVHYLLARTGLAVAPRRDEYGKTPRAESPVASPLRDLAQKPF